MPPADVDRLSALAAGPEAPEALFFGDSVLERRANDDDDGRTLGEMTAEALRPLRLTQISGTGYHSGMYYRFLEAALHAGGRPRVVMLPVNLRSFSPQWHYHPLWSYRVEMDELRRLAGAAAEPYLDDAPGTSYEDIAVDYPGMPFKRIGDFTRVIETKTATAEQRAERLRCIFVFHYLHELRADHPKLLYLERIARTVRRAGAALYLYFTPINVEAGVRYAGPGFMTGVERNKRTTEQSILAAAGAQVRLADHAALFDAGAFFTHDNATEHLRAPARRSLAATLARESAEMLL